MKQLSSHRSFVVGHSRSHDEIDSYGGSDYNKNEDGDEDTLMKSRTVLVVHCLTMLLLRSVLKAVQATHDNKTRCHLMMPGQEGDNPDIVD